jgi:NDP-sugar pyrophosphorylase family protein
VVKAVVLAGGLGTRLAPLTATLPKPLVPVLNYPLLGRVLVGLRRADLHDIGVTIGPHADQMRRCFGDGGRLGVRITWLQDAAVVGTGGALRDHAWFLGDQPALVVTADMLSTLDPAAVIRHHRRHPAAVTVAVHPVDLATWPGDIIHADGPDGLAYQFKPGPRRALSNLGSTGTWVVDPAILAELPPGHVDFSSDVLPSLPTQRHRLGVYHAGPIRLRDFGQFDTYHQGNLEALHGHYGIRPTGNPLGPAIWAEAGVSIHPTATLTGPLALGRQITIGPHAQLVGPSIVGHGAPIGAGAAVIRSVVLPGGSIADGTLAANAVIGMPEALLPRLLDHR